MGSGIMSDSDQYEAVMFLLANGADPNRGNALHWLVLRFYCQQEALTEVEFKELFHRIIQDYGANVNDGPFMIEALHDCFYQTYGDLKSNLPDLKGWSNRFLVAITIFVQYKSDINLQCLKKERSWGYSDDSRHKTILSLFM
jgi:hypothetical protein